MANWELEVNQEILGLEDHTAREVNRNGQDLLLAPTAAQMGKLRHTIRKWPHQGYTVVEKGLETSSFIKSFSVVSARVLIVLLV